MHKLVFPLLVLSKSIPFGYCQLKRHLSVMKCFLSTKEIIEIIEMIPIKCNNATSRPLFVEADSKKFLIPLKFQTHFVPFSQMLLQHWREIHFYSKTLFGVTLLKSTKRCHLNSFSSTLLEFL